MRICAIDFETANESPASVCSVGIAVMEDGCILDTYTTLIRPADNVSRFSKWNIAVHGIYPSDVKDAPSFCDIYSDITGILEGSLVTAHNAAFDMKCLKAACLNNGLPVPHLRYFDTVQLSRAIFPALDSHKLNIVCDYMHVELDHHKADSDAYGCLMIAVNAMNLTEEFDPEKMLQICGVRIKELF